MTLIGVQVKYASTRKLAGRSANWSGREQKQLARIRVLLGLSRMTLPEEVA